MNRARPLIEDVVLDVEGGSSRMETAAAILFYFFGLYVSKALFFWGSMGGRSIAWVEAGVVNAVNQ